MKTVLRIALAVILGNALGYGFFQLAGWLTPQLWRDGSPPDFGTLLFKIGVTAIAFGTPPMIVSALAARAAGRYEPWVGLGAALWGITARSWWPASVPLLPPESWVAPMTLILTSGLIGGWLMTRHPPLNLPQSQPLPPDAPDSSKDSVI